MGNTMGNTKYPLTVFIRFKRVSCRTDELITRFLNLYKGAFWQFGGLREAVVAV